MTTMTTMRAIASVALLGAVLLVVGSVGPWSTIGDRQYFGIDGAGILTAVLALGIGAAAGLCLSTPTFAGAGRWILVPPAVLALLVTGLSTIDVVTSTAADVAQRVVGGELTREPTWGLWVALMGAVVATLAAVVALAVPPPAQPARPVWTS